MKLLAWRLQLYWKETPIKVFSCEFYRIFKGTFFIEHLWWPHLSSPLFNYLLWASYWMGKMWTTDFVLMSNKKSVLSRALVLIQKKNIDKHRFNLDFYLCFFFFFFFSLGALFFWVICVNDPEFAIRLY